jgi:hypothetical protein
MKRPKRIKTSAGLRADPRVKELWSEVNFGEKQWWCQLADGWIDACEGVVCIMEYSIAEVCSVLNEPGRVIKEATT